METTTHGIRIGEYEILGELGRGAMGVVYRAHDPSLKRDVALKVLAEHLAGDESYVARFHQEAQAAAQLSHPNIVTIHEIGCDENKHYIAMEYIRGEEVAALIARTGPLATARALAIARQVASALGAAHALGIIHRDIKPRNIMVDDQNRIKVMDFGVAKVGDALSQVATADGRMIGTPAYMAPEQFIAKQIDTRCDLYSLGVVLYQMLATRTPHQADTPAAMMQHVVNEAAAPLDVIRPDLPEALVHCVMRALAKNPDERYQTAEEFQKELEMLASWETTVPSASLKEISTIIVDGAALVAEPTTVALPAPRPRARQLAWGVGAGVAVLAGLTVFALWPSGEGSGSTAAPALTEPPIQTPLLVTPIESADAMPVIAATTATLTTPGQVVTEIPAGEGFIKVTVPKKQEVKATGGAELRKAIELYSGVNGVVDASETKRIITKLAKNGDEMARMWRAWFTHWGRCGFPKDEAQAGEWGARVFDEIKTLADDGDPDAMFLTGAAMDVGMGAKHDPVKAMEYIRRAAEAGETTAMNYLGYVYYAGNDSPADLQQAFEWFSRAAEARDVNAMHNLGKLYENGHGVGVDDAKAVKWYRRGADAASPSNMNDLGWMYENGRGVAKDRAEAVRLYSKAAELGDELAAENLRKLQGTQ